MQQAVPQLGVLDALQRVERALQAALRRQPGRVLVQNCLQFAARLEKHGNGEERTTIVMRIIFFSDILLH